MAESKQVREEPPPRGGSFGAWFLALLAMAGCGALGWYYWQLRRAHDTHDGALSEARASAESCIGELEPVRTSAKACEDARAEDRERIDELARSQAEVETNLQASASELESLRKLKAEAEKGAAAFEALKRDLQDMIATGQVEVRWRDGRMVVQLPAEVLFASGSADLSEEGKVALIKLSAVLEKMPERKFMIAGHTDSLAPAKGSKFVNNWALSTARALTVTELLVTAKINPKNLVAAGYGEFAPIATNASEGGRKQNRRIEIVLLPDLDELPEIAGQPPTRAP
jgi:chemotaxis protein MotB